MLVWGFPSTTLQLRSDTAGSSEECRRRMSAEQPIHRRPGGTLYRYIAREMIFPTAFALGGLTLVVLTKNVLGYSEMVINRGLGFDAVSWIAFYQLVPLAAQMTPFAVLVGRQAASRSADWWAQSLHSRRR
jgi:hypothetical protein